MLLYLYGSPMEDLQVSSADGTVAFAIETHPYLNDRRTEVYNADGEVLGSIIWAGSQPSHICVYSDNAVQSGPFQMIPRSDPARFVTANYFGSRQLTMKQFRSIRRCSWRRHA